MYRSRAAHRLPDRPLRCHLWAEMCRHLYQWDETVKVIAPGALREMAEGYRRSDFYPVVP